MSHRAPSFPLPPEALQRARVHEALVLLREAFQSARALQRDAWDFAVEFQELRSTGVSNTDLRWLLCRGYIQHGVEQTAAAAPHRTFNYPQHLAFSPRTCFTLTPEGLLYLGEVARPVRAALRPEPAVATVRPCWDGARRQLVYQGYLVKQFRLPARNQELILAVLEEEDWPPRIDDPLPPALDQDARARLHDTIRGLNRNQVHRLLCFTKDGTGEGVLWHGLTTDGGRSRRARGEPDTREPCPEAF